MVGAPFAPGYSLLYRMGSCQTPRLSIPLVGVSGAPPPDPGFNRPLGAVGGPQDDRAEIQALADPRQLDTSGIEPGSTPPRWTAGAFRRSVIAPRSPPARGARLTCSPVRPDLRHPRGRASCTPAAVFQAAIAPSAATACCVLMTPNAPSTGLRLFRDLWWNLDDPTLQPVLHPPVDPAEAGRHRLHGRVVQAPTGKP